MGHTLSPQKASSTERIVVGKKRNMKGKRTIRQITLKEWRKGIMKKTIIFLII